jgi:hypothetical protein
MLFDTQAIVDNLLLSNVPTIETDRLDIYQSLISNQTCKRAYNRNHI